MSFWEETPWGLKASVTKLPLATKEKSVFLRESSNDSVVFPTGFKKPSFSELTALYLREGHRVQF